MKEIYIIRHGETELNRKGIVQGSGVDASLNDMGRQQAAAFHSRYKTITFDIIIASALKRAQETIAPFEKPNLPKEYYPELNEISWGVHEGKTSSPEMKSSYSAMVREWKNGNYDARLEGGESAAELRNRLQKFIEILKQKQEKKMLICSHGRTLRAFMCLLAGDPLSEMDQYHHYNTGLYKVNLIENQFFFERSNDLEHLKDLGIRF